MTRVWSNGTKQQEEPGGCTPQVTTSETDFNMKEARSEEEEQEEKEKKSFFGLCFSEDLEKELAEQSKVALKMIYFFQVLPFYILQFTSGMALGYPSILVPQLISSNNTDIVMDNDSKGWVVSLDYGTTAVIALVSGQFQMMFGPKKTSLMACIPISLAWILMAYADNIYIIYASRMLTGLGNGILTSSVYIVEVVSANRRGSVVMIETAFRSLGLITVYLLGTFIHWQSLAVIVTPLPIFALLYGYFIPESPIFLSQVAGYTQIDGERGSLNTSAWHQWKKSSLSTWRLFERSDVRVPLMLLVVVIVAQQCSGMKIIQGYAVEIFADTFSERSEGGLKHGHEVDTVAYWSAVIMGGVRLVATLLAALYITNFGRKTMYFMSTSLTIIFQIAFGLVHLLGLGSQFKFIPIIIICGQVFFLQLGLQTFPNLLSSELFPNDARSRCKGFIRAFSALSSALMLKLFPYAEVILGLHGTFWLLAAVLFVIIPFIYLYVPEAKDVDLNNIDEFFKPVETKFYVEFPLNESGLPGSLESSHRIQMIQNSFGTAGTSLNDGTRILFAEGFLIKRNGDRRNRRHFFLFNDILLWGSVIKENINYIRQRMIKLNGLQIENIKESNCWRVVTSDGNFVLEADSEEQKVKWMLLIHFAQSRLENNPVADDGSERSSAGKSDFLVLATEKISEKSNKTIDEIFVNLENGKPAKSCH